MSEELQPPLCENYSDGIVLVLWPSGKVQQFPSLAKAKTMLMRQHYQYIVCTPAEAMAIFELNVDDWGERWKLDSEHYYTEKTLWQYLMDISIIRDPWMKSGDIPDTNRLSKRVTASGYTVHHNKCVGFKGPKQARVIADVLLQSYEDASAVSTEDIERVLKDASLKGVLKTKQDPKRIFAYYRGSLIEAGCLTLRS